MRAQAPKLNIVPWMLPLSMLYGYNFFSVTLILIYPLLFLPNVIILAPPILHTTRYITYFTQDRKMLLRTISLFVKRLSRWPYDFSCSHLTTTSRCLYERCLCFKIQVVLGESSCSFLHFIVRDKFKELCTCCNCLINSHTFRPLLFTQVFAFFSNLS